MVLFKARCDFGGLHARLVCQTLGSCQHVIFYKYSWSGIPNLHACCRCCYTHRPVVVLLGFVICCCIVCEKFSDSVTDLIIGCFMDSFVASQCF